MSKKIITDKKNPPQIWAAFNNRPLQMANDVAYGHCIKAPVRIYQLCACVHVNGKTYAPLE